MNYQTNAFKEFESRGGRLKVFPFRPLAPQALYVRQCIVHSLLSEVLSVAVILYRKASVKNFSERQKPDYYYKCSNEILYSTD